MSPGSIGDMRRGLESGTLSAVGLAQASLLRMERLEPLLNAIACPRPTQALEAARHADGRMARGERGGMLGIPFVLKDNFSWAGAPVGHGSHITEGYLAPYSATVVRRLLEAGAVPVAKANMDEFAMGSSGEHSALGPTRNPWDPGRVPGGSSSGSVVSISAGYVPFALGSDTGGSVRLPAGFCGVTALRPTYGVLSRHGLTAMASSLDQPGPVARSARDLAAGLAVLAGRDPLDATSVDLPGSERLSDLRAAPLEGLRVGLPRETFTEGLDPGVRQCLDAALGRLRELGAILSEVALPHTRYAIDTYYLINTSEVSSNLGRFDGVRFGARSPGRNLQDMMAATRDAGLGPEAKRRILLGAFCLSKGHREAFYLRAQKARTLIARDFARAFQEVDLVATPLCPGPAFPLGARTAEPLSMYLSDIFTVTPALAALPALALPAGFVRGLPVGLQFIGPSLSDVRILEWAQAFQEATGHHLPLPPLA